MAVTTVAFRNFAKRVQRNESQTNEQQQQQWLRNESTAGTTALYHYVSRLLFFVVCVLSVVSHFSVDSPRQ